MKSDLQTFFGYVGLKKNHVSYPSIMNFEGRLASAPNEICDFFTELIKRKYADDDWMYSDPGLDLLQDNPTFNAIQYTVDEVHNVFMALDVSKGASPDDIPPRTMDR
jgi:hypothetical protein